MGNEVIIRFSRGGKAKGFKATSVTSKKVGNATIWEFGRWGIPVASIFEQELLPGHLDKAKALQNRCGSKSKPKPI